MRIIRTKNYEEMSQKAANVVSSVVTLKPDCVLGLATGDTPIGMYQLLVDRYKMGDLDFKDVKTVNLDEYVGLSGEHPQSYHKTVSSNFPPVKKIKFYIDGKEATDKTPVDLTQPWEALKTG